MICEFCHKHEVRLKWIGQEHDIYECLFCGHAKVINKPIITSEELVDIEEPPRDFEALRGAAGRKKENDDE